MSLCEYYTYIRRYENMCMINLQKLHVNVSNKHKINIRQSSTQQVQEVVINTQSGNVQFIEWVIMIMITTRLLWQQKMEESFKYFACSFDNQWKYKHG